MLNQRSHTQIVLKYPEQVNQDRKQIGGCQGTRERIIKNHSLICIGFSFRVMNVLKVDDGEEYTTL